MSLQVNALTGEPFLLIPAASGGSGVTFKTWQCPNGTSPVAASSADTMTLTSSGGTVTITGNSSTDTVNLDVSFFCFGVLSGTSGSATAASAGDTATLTCTDNSQTITGSSKTLTFARTDLAYHKQNPYFFEDFANGPFQSNNHFFQQGVSGGGFANPDSADYSGRWGVIQCKVNSGASGNYWVFYSAAVGVDTSKGSYTVEIDFRLEQTPNGTNDFELFMGVGGPLSAHAIASLTQSIGLLAQRANSTSGSNFVARVQSAAGTITDMDTGVAFDTSWHKLQMVITSSNVKFYLDGVLKATNTGTLPATTATMGWTCFGQAVNVAAAATYINFDYYFTQLNLTVSR